MPQSETMTKADRGNKRARDTFKSEDDVTFRRVRKINKQQQQQQLQYIVHDTEHLIPSRPYTLTHDYYAKELLCLCSICM